MRRSGIKIMWGLLKLLKPLAPVMVLCILMGTAGFFCAIAITVLGANLLLTAADLSPWVLSFSAGAAAMAVCAAARAALRYGEQICGHFIAFRLLAILRDKLFGALRRLAPAKLETKGRGDLISLITGDIELLEVFYAHTIAPVCIARTGIGSHGLCHRSFPSSAGRGGRDLLSDCGLRHSAGVFPDGPQTGHGSEKQVRGAEQLFSRKPAGHPRDAAVRRR